MTLGLLKGSMVVVTNPSLQLGNNMDALVLDTCQVCFEDDPEISPTWFVVVMVDDSKDFYTAHDTCMEVLRESEPDVDYYWTPEYWSPLYLGY